MNALIVAGTICTIDGKSFLRACKALVLQKKGKSCTELIGNLFFPLDWPVEDVHEFLRMSPPNQMMYLPENHEIPLHDAYGEIVAKLKTDEIINRYCGITTT